MKIISRLTGCALLLLAGPLSAEPWREVDLNERIKKWLSMGPGTIVEIGELDLDADGDLDRLVNVIEYSSDKPQKSWTAYMNDNGQHYLTGVPAHVVLRRNNVEFRRIKQSDGQRAVVWYDARPGKEGRTLATWYDKVAEGEFERKVKIIDEGSLLAPREDDAVSAASDGNGRSRGLKIEAIFKNYKRYTPDDITTDNLSR